MIGRYFLYLALKTSACGDHRIERDQTIRLSTKNLVLPVKMLERQPLQAIVEVSLAQLN